MLRKLSLTAGAGFVALGCYIAIASIAKRNSGMQRYGWAQRWAWALLVSAALLALPSLASAQAVAPGGPAGIVCAYNTSPPTVSSGQFVYGQCDNTGKLQVNATVSATATIVGFAPNGNFASLSAGTTTSNIALPAGTVVTISNLDATNTAYVNLGVGAGTTATTSQEPIPAGQTVAITVGTNTYLAAITTSSTASIRLTGGSGIFTGVGGGGASGGGGGGAITAASGSYSSGALALGSIVDLGTGGSPGANTVNGRLAALITALGTPFQAGGSIGNTGFNVTGTLPAFASTPTFNLGTLNGAATSANQPTNAAQGSTTSGQTGNLALAAVTTSPPSYTTSQTSPLSLDTAGNLRVNVVTGGGSGGTSSSFGGTFPATGTAIGAKNGANMVNLAADSSNNLNVNVQTSALPTGAATAANQSTEITSLATIATNSGSPIPAGTALIGKVGIDQTTPGTTNGVQLAAAIPAGTNLIGKTGIDQTTAGTTNAISLAQIGANTVSSGNGVSGTGVQRVAIASDNTPYAVKVTDAGGTNQLNVVAASTAPVTASNTAVVVDLRPDSPGIITLGGATPANSVPTVSAGYTYGHIATATTTTLKSGAGVVHTICINTLGTVASTVTVDDATSATTPNIAIINSLALLGCQTFDVAFATGLTIVTTGTVAPDVTVSYR